jgi:hypothetical protein
VATRLFALENISHERRAEYKHKNESEMEISLKTPFFVFPLKIANFLV